MSNSENMELNRLEELTEQLAAVTAERDGLRETLSAERDEREKAIESDLAEAGEWDDKFGKQVKNVKMARAEIAQLTADLDAAIRTTAERAVALCRAKGQVYYYESSEAKSEGAYDCADAIRAEFKLSDEGATK